MNISNEAVEAAARALWDLDRDSTASAYEDCRDGAKRALRREVSAILEAAAPYLLQSAKAEAWDEGGDARMEREHAYGREEKAKFSNPYRPTP